MPSVSTFARWLLLGSCLLTLDCAARPPRAYREAEAAARRAYAHGRYVEAARAWSRAATAADRDADRVEATYRQAASLRRAGKWSEAAAVYGLILQNHPASARAARAAYERAVIEIEHGRRDRAGRFLEHVLATYPESAMASRALDRAVVHLGDSDKLAYLTRWIVEAHDTELEQYARYRRARLTEAMGDPSQARMEYLRLAERFPYPDGPYWDDALWYAAAIDRRAGRPARAIQLLQHMLTRQESSHISGSYERGRYSEASYRIAEIYRDDLGDSERSRAAFARFYDVHPTSRLRDDAKWHEARLSHELGDSRGACRALRTLTRDEPQSRFVACAHVLCPDIDRSGPARCHDYIIRDIESSN